MKKKPTECSPAEVEATLRDWPARGGARKGAGRKPGTGAGRTVREALQRCATMDDGWASSALHDAEQCEKSDHPAIRTRATELRHRAENYKLAAARYRSALNWLVG